jgi:hypothetical protein
MGVLLDATKYMKKRIDIQLGIRTDFRPLIDTSNLLILIL